MEMAALLVFFYLAICLHRINLDQNGHLFDLMYVRLLFFFCHWRSRLDF